MRKFILFFYLITTPLFIHTVPYQASPLMEPQEDSLDIVVNNRVLAKVNNEAITVLDVRKQLDMIFYRQYPQYASSPVIRYQFYNSSWKQVLKDLVGQKLILADAEQLQMKVKPSEVRQELEVYFGPNIIENLHEAELSVEEASKMIRDDIAIRRMMLFRVNNKAMSQANPQEIRNAHNDIIKNYVSNDEWVYATISIRDHDQANGAAIANQIYIDLTENGSSIEDLPSRVKIIPQYTPLSSVKISDEYRVNEEDLSPSHLDILALLEPGTFSNPIPQKSRRDNSMVFRIFYLQEHNQDDPPSFASASNEIKQKLINKATSLETENYLNNLREKFAVEEIDLDQLDFEPFTIKKKR